MGPCAPAGAYQHIRKGYDHETAAREAIGRIETISGRPIHHTTLLSYERLVTLYEHVLFLEGQRIPGCLVECGVWRGGAAALMALACLAEGREPRMLHLFDSFQGLPAPKLEYDGAVGEAMTGRSDGALVGTGVWAADADDVRRLIVDAIGYPSAFVTIHQGWFQDTLPVASGEIGPVALLRVDGDWYESTKVALQYLYPLVTSEGLVVFDDYGTFAGCRQACDEYLASHQPDAYLHYIDYAGRYLVKPRSARVIVDPPRLDV